jgi:hypothetical protein
MHPERLHFAQQEQTQGLVKFGASQGDGCYWGITQALPGMKTRIRFDLPGEIGGCA